MNLLVWAGRKVVQKVCLLCFVVIPYGRRRRNRVPDFSGHVILAASHNNFFCDISVVGNETKNLPGWLAKVGLFSPPFGPLLRFLGALPVVRILDASKMKGKAREINEASFAAVVNRIREPGVFCIFPEGNCLERPGLNLPLKNGIAKMAFTAEAESRFQLNLRVIPMGIDYDIRSEFAGGIDIRYGEPIYLHSYREIFERDPKEAERRFMDELTRQMLQIYPHFDSKEDLHLAERWHALDTRLTRFELAQIFKDFALAPELRSQLSHYLDHVDEQFTKILKGQRLVSPQTLVSWANWQRGSDWTRLRIAFISLVTSPVLLFSVLHNFLPGRVIRICRERISRLSPDFMTLQVALSILLLPLVYGVQWGLMRAFVSETWNGWFLPSHLSFATYLLVSVASWCWQQQWDYFLRQFLAALRLQYFKDSEALYRVINFQDELRFSVSQRRAHSPERSA